MCYQKRSDSFMKDFLKNKQMKQSDFLYTENNQVISASIRKSRKIGDQLPQNILHLMAITN